MKHIGLFEGIGGFSLAARWAGWETVAWCEWNEFGQKVLKHHFPEAEGFGDITKTDFTKYANRIDILTGGFPCQPYSVAGKQLGKEDERHLWPEMLRAIREISPRWVVGENVRGLVSWNGGMVFDEVQTDLETAGYEVLPFLLPACAVNAPHRRDRIWFVAYKYCIGLQKARAKQQSTGFARIDTQDVAYSKSENRERLSERKEEKFPKSGFNGCYGIAPYANSGERRQGRIYKTGPKEADGYTSPRDSRDSWSAWQNFPTQSPVCDGDDGFCTESLRQRIREDSMGALSEKEIDKIFSEAVSEWRKETIKAGGNAIVPQVAYQIFKAINQFENDSK